MSYEIRQVKSVLQTLEPRERLDQGVMSEQNLRRLAATASIIPKAPRRGARLLDIGGRIEWIPIYAKLLGYEHVTILERPGGSFFNDLRVPGQGTDFIADTVEADAELDRYPLERESIDCVVCCHVIEHLAGDPMHLIAESNRILKLGGFMCLTTPNILYHRNLVRFLFGGHPFGWSVFTDSYADRHNREYTPFEIKGLFEAAGFTVDLLKTQTHRPYRGIAAKALGFGLCLPAALLGRVSFRLRGDEMQVRARKTCDVKERYPKFLYNLFGSNAVTVKIKGVKVAEWQRGAAEPNTQAAVSEFVFGTLVERH